MVIRFAGVPAVEAAEFRQARRLGRTWLVALLAVGGGGWSVYRIWSVAAAAPRFALPGTGMLTLRVLLFGVVLLGFDIRARDGRERIAAALDTRPVSNNALPDGRRLGIAFAAWLPLAVWALLLQGTGMIVKGMNLSDGVPPEPVSLATFVFLEAPPAVLLWGR